MPAPTPMMGISRSAGKKEKYSVFKGGNVYGYKINIKVGGKIEGATSVTQHTSIQLGLKMY